MSNVAPSLSSCAWVASLTLLTACGWKLTRESAADAAPPVASVAAAPAAPSAPPPPIASSVAPVAVAAPVVTAAVPKKPAPARLTDDQCFTLIKQHRQTCRPDCVAKWKVRDQRMTAAERDAFCKNVCNNQENNDPALRSCQNIGKSL